MNIPADLVERMAELVRYIAAGHVSGVYLDALSIAKELDAARGRL